VSAARAAAKASAYRRQEQVSDTERPRAFEGLPRTPRVQEQNDWSRPAEQQGTFEGILDRWLSW
jgi:hypothetical protein